jgi:hypothetical protein
MRASRGMGSIMPKKVPRAKRRGDSKPVIGTGKPIRTTPRKVPLNADAD